ncbi:ester cyclase [Pseudarthrobacter sp. S3]|uniref:ester cyclase n=1 Tax=unclassified Pseudarthrobacter TaxID=2647000 RepID=UPI003CEA8729
MGNSDELRRAYRQLIGAVAANDEDALAGIVSSDIVDHGAGPGQPPGLAGIVFWMRGFHASLSAFTGSVEDTVVEGDKVAGRVTWRGTHTGPFLGLAATGKPVTVVSIHVLRFEDGLAVEWWGVPDLYGALIMLGARLELQSG